MVERANGNGNGWKTSALGVLVAIVFALCGVAWAGHEHRIGTLETSGAAPIRERLATVEQEQVSTRDVLLRMLQQLDRIEARQLRLMEPQR